ncbi:MAG: ArnT family glycosyltransferase [Anaerolineales bacterium]
MTIDSSVMQKKPLSIWIMLLIGAVCAAALLKIGLLLSDSIPFNSDEAIVALMAKHILKGERPFFFYGQAYMGSLDAYLIAVVYKILGEQVWGVRLVQIVLYSFTLITTAILGFQVTGKWKVGVLAAWLLAIPNVNTTLYTTVSLGGYGETLVIGNLILITTLKIGRDMTEKRDKLAILLWFVLGFLCGFGLWVFGLTLVYAIPAFIYLAWLLFRSIEAANAGLVSETSSSFTTTGYGTNQIDSFLNQSKIWGVTFVGITIGALPWWAYAQYQGVSNLLLELGGGAISGVESMSLFGQFLQHLINFILFGSTAMLGLRPPWEIRWLVLPLAPLVLAFWSSVIVFAIKKTLLDLKIQPGDPGYSHAPLLFGVMLTVLAAFILSPFGADPSGRYFLPIAVIMVLFCSQAVWKWHVSWGKYIWIAVSLLILFNLGGTIQTARAFPPGITTQFDVVTQVDHSYDQELVGFLERNGEYTGYTNYWVSYPLAFHSEEKMIFLPRLPYHQDLRYTPRDDRYKPYELFVQNSVRTAYITTNNPNLDQQIRSGFISMGVKWNEAQIGDYRIYYHLSRNVHPDEIGLGGYEG